MFPVDLRPTSEKVPRLPQGRRQQLSLLDRSILELFFKVGLQMLVQEFQITRVRYTNLKLLLMNTICSPRMLA